MSQFFLVLESLRCDKTTELGHDEVYFLVSTGGAESKSLVGPDAAHGATADNNTAWDMNDSGSQQDQTFNATLYSGSVPSGQQEIVSLTFMERDGTSVADEVKAAASIASAIGKDTGNSYVELGATIANALTSFIPGNEDDLLGSCTLVLQGGDSGTELGYVLAQQGGAIASPVDLSTGRFVLSLTGSGASYTAHLRISGLEPDQVPRWNAPSAGTELLGVALLDLHVPFADTVWVDAYWATNPDDVTTVGWRRLGQAIHDSQNPNRWTLSYDTTQILDQDNAGWGTVNFVVGASLQGTQLTSSSESYRRFGIKNHRPPTPPPWHPHGPISKPISLPTEPLRR